jgi:pyridoxal phosphate enzyme (YggS family)
MRERLEKVHLEIEEACRASGRRAEEVKLIAVSKTKAAEDIRSLAELGVRDFGENYVQEALPKLEALQKLSLQWHFIGSLQSNKAKFIPSRFDWLHTLHSFSLAEKLHKAIGPGTPLNCLIEVNIDQEGSKAGLPPEALPDFLESVAALPSLQVRGLMCIPSTENPQAAFARLRELKEQANRAGAYPQTLTELSMGMSGDFGLAIREGATMVRVGTALFGKRA